uniref:Uncharacterized protein n=1 Tax=Anguilla anguilla TaxID=7936 RepID=A0A0E9QFH1_ANGAN
MKTRLLRGSDEDFRLLIKLAGTFRSNQKCSLVQRLEWECCYSVLKSILLNIKFHL